MHRAHRLTAVILAFLAFLMPVAVSAQEAIAPPPDALAPQAYSPEQIEQLVAPVALYPDPLLGQVLMASTYPLEIVEASRWLQDPANAGLQGDALGGALEQQHWDPSVKSLVQFPQVLSMMDGNLQWTEQLGNAFLAQQLDVGNAVQNLRSRAAASGNLASTPQQTISGEPGQMVIMPAQPEVVYVPVYNPQVVYGAWPYPSYPPYYFAPPRNYYYSAPGIISFGIGIGVVDLFWGWDRWDWRHRHIYIDDNRYERINRGRPPLVRGEWEHNPYHRHGVPYSNPTVRQHYNATAEAARANYRGYEATHGARPLTGTSSPRSNDRSHDRNVQGRPQNQQHEEHVQQSPQPENPAPRVTPLTGHMPQTPQGNNDNRSRWQHSNNQSPPVQENRQAAPTVTTAPSQAETEHRQYRSQQRQQQVRQAPQQQMPRNTAPVYESFSHGPDVRAQSQRGAHSRASMPIAQPQAQQAQPQPQPQHQNRPAPNGGDHGGDRGGNHGGDGNYGDRGGGDRGDHGRNH